MIKITCTAILYGLLAVAGAAIGAAAAPLSPWPSGFGHGSALFLA
jgi:hypothetical protein